MFRLAILQKLEISSTSSYGTRGMSHSLRPRLPASTVPLKHTVQRLPRASLALRSRLTALAAFHLYLSTWETGIHGESRRVTNAYSLVTAAVGSRRPDMSVGGGESTRLWTQRPGRENNEWHRKGLVETVGLTTMTRSVAGFLAFWWVRLMRYSRTGGVVVETHTEEGVRRLIVDASYSVLRSSYPSIFKATS